MYRKRAAPPIPKPPTTNRRTGAGIRYGCHERCFQESAKLSIAVLSFSGCKMANKPKLRKSAAIANAAGASLRLGIVPSIHQKSNIDHIIGEIGILSETAIHPQ